MSLRLDGTVRQAGLHLRPAPPRAPIVGLVEGVVLATYAADDPTGRRTGFLRCDVLTEGGGRLLSVRVLNHGASVTNGARWWPQPCRANLESGEAVDLVGNPASAPVNIDALDGERVLVAFVGGNPTAPVIVGAVDHPRTRRPHNGAEPGPLPDPSATQNLEVGPEGNERWIGHQGTVARLDRAGNVRLDTRAAGTANDGSSAEVEGGGHVDLNLKPGASLVVRVDGVPLLRAQRVGDELRLDAGASPTERVLLAGPTVEHLTTWQAAVDALAAQVVALTTALAATPGAPPVVPFVWVPPAAASAEASRLRSGVLRVSPLDETEA